MEYARHVRHFLLDKKEFSPQEEDLIIHLQKLHIRYLDMMNTFSNQMSKHAISMSPEARMSARQLRLDIYQEWKTKIMELFFIDPSALPESDADRLLRIERQLGCLSIDSTDSDTQPVVQRLEEYLNRYENRLQDYVAECIKSGKRCRPNSSGSLSPGGSTRASDEQFPECLETSPL